MKCPECNWEMKENACEVNGFLDQKDVGMFFGYFSCDDCGIKSLLMFGRDHHVHYKTVEVGE